MNRFLFLFLLLCSLVMSQPMEREEEPLLGCTLYMVPELDACQPRGYANYDEGDSGCRLLTMDDVERWDSLGYFKLDIPYTPPAVVSLGPALLQRLDTYRTARRISPSTGMSIVLVFDWGGPHYDTMTLKRLGTEDGAIPPMTWAGDLGGDIHWIHHERADAFLPINDIRWTVESGEYRWEFVTGP